MLPKWLPWGWILAGFLGLRIDVILPEEKGPYAEALSGFKEKFTGEVQTYLVENISHPQGDLLLALGQKSMEKAIAIASGKPILVCMVLTVDNPYREKVSGVTLLINPWDVFQAMKEITPWAKRIGIFETPDTFPSYLTNAKESAKAFQLEILPIPVKTEKDIFKQIPAMQGKMDILWILPDPLIGKGTTVDYLMETSLRRGIPVVGPSPYFTQRGALFSLSPDFKSVGAQTASLVEKVAGGEKAGIFPPQNLLLSLNSKVAEIFNIHFSRSLLKKAWKVY